MKCIAWNIKGGKKREALQELRFLINNHKPDVIFVMETMTSLITDTYLQIIFPTYNVSVVTLSGHSGGYESFTKTPTFNSSQLPIS